jgi:hypothetical protein
VLRLFKILVCKNIEYPFAWLAIGFSVAVGVGSVYYFKKSKQQLKNILKTLEG